MNFNVYDWLYQIVVEGIKYILIAHYFLGFEFSKGKKKYLPLLYPVILLVIEYWDNQDILFLYHYAWGVILLIGVFEEKLAEKIKAFFIIWFLVALVDALLLVLYIMFLNVLFTNKSGGSTLFLGSLSLFFWGITVRKGKKIRQYTKKFWKKLSNREYFLSLLLLFMGVLFVGGMQGNLDNTMTLSIKGSIFILGVLLTWIFIIVLLLFIKTKQSKKQLEKENEFNVRYLKLQKQYYENSLKQYEDMRRFRHDINHHIYMLSEMSRGNRIEELKEYIEKMAKSYEEIRGIHTGNFIADCIISHAICELQDRKEFHFDLDGHFPENFFLEDIDFCILLANLLENAKEALEKINGESFLQIEVKSFQQWFYLTIRNSVDSDKVDFRITSKEDKSSHGLGIQNIRRIVEKYQGNVVWNYEKGFVEVKMKFDQSKLK